MYTSVRVADAAVRVIDYSGCGGGYLHRGSCRSSYRLVHAVARWRPPCDIEAREQARSALARS